MVYSKESLVNSRSTRQKNTVLYSKDVSLRRDVSRELGLGLEHCSIGGTYDSRAEALWANWLAPGLPGGAGGIVFARRGIRAAGPQAGSPGCIERHSRRRQRRGQTADLAEPFRLAAEMRIGESRRQGDFRQVAE